MNAIEITNLSKNYDGFCLKNVNITMPQGSVMGFIGQNGAGKTTTIKALLNLIKRDDGEIKIFGLENIKNEEEIKQQISVVFDEPCFHDILTAKQINQIFKHIYREWSEETFFNYMTKFELPLKRKFKVFSRGMRMKMQIAVALSHNAKLLILDEPTSGLDPVVRNEMLDVFMEYMQNEERSILISSHITVDLEQIADYITFINKGGILLSGRKDEILESYGIIKCGKDDSAKIAKEDIVASKVTEFGTEMMVSDRQKCKAKYPGLIIDKATLDEIMVFHVKGVTK